MEKLLTLGVIVCKVSKFIVAEPCKIFWFCYKLDQNISFFFNQKSMNLNTVHFTSGLMHVSRICPAINTSVYTTFLYDTQKTISINFHNIKC